MIVASAKDAGIRLHAKVKDFNTWQSDRNTGKFDLVVDNHYQLSDNPWTYWNGIFHLPVITTGTGQTFANYGRYDNASAWALTQKLDKTPPSNTKAITSDQQPAADDPDEGSARDSALVQRNLGADDVEVLDELAVRDQQPPVRAGDVERLLADDGDRHDHPSEEHVEDLAGPLGPSASMTEHRPSRSSTSPREGRRLSSETTAEVIRWPAIS